MMDHPGEDLTVPRSVWIGRAPLLVAAALIALITGVNLTRLVLADSPRDPWEASQVLEGWRSLRGMPVYELGPAGHSTQPYGTLLPLVQGEIFRWVGPNNISGRLLSLVAALVTVTLLAVTMRGDRSGWYLPVAWAMILGINHRSGQYFAENRPDMLALMFAAAAVLLMGYGQEKRRWPFVVLGSACLVAGFFFKQTAFIFCTMPLVTLILRWRRPDRSELVLAMIPPSVAFGVVLALRVLDPAVYYYMIVVPKAYALNWPRAARVGWEFLVNSPLFLVLVGDWIVSGERSLRKCPRALWLFSALAVAIPYSAVTTAKFGGWFNSLLPALLPMMAFCALRLPALLRRLEDAALPARSRLMFGTFLALLIAMTTFPQLTKYLLEPAAQRDVGYEKVVDLAARLPGMVVCPEDPTIPLYAKGHTGQNVYAEKDTHLVNGEWPVAIPELILAELRAADYAVDVTDTGGWYDSLTARHFRELGFEAAKDLSRGLDGYEIWRRKSIDRPSQTQRTASLEDRPTTPR